MITTPDHISDTGINRLVEDGELPKRRKIEPMKLKAYEDDCAFLDEDTFLCDACGALSPTQCECER